MRLFGVGFSSRQIEEFDPSKPFRCCLLCGAMYQPKHFRDELTPLVYIEYEKQVWAENHALQEHTQYEHELLRISGMSITPEAATKLAAFGFVPLTDMMQSEEVASALSESSSIQGYHDNLHD